MYFYIESWLFIEQRRVSSGQPSYSPREGRDCSPAGFGHIECDWSTTGKNTGKDTAEISKNMKPDKRPEVAKKEEKNNAQKRSHKWDKNNQ